MRIERYNFENLGSQNVTSMRFEKYNFENLVESGGQKRRCKASQSEIVKSLFVAFHDVIAFGDKRILVVGKYLVMTYCKVRKFVSKGKAKIPVFREVKAVKGVHISNCFHHLLTFKFKGVKIILLNTFSFKSWVLPPLPAPLRRCKSEVQD